MLDLLNDLLWSKVLIVTLVGLGLYFSISSRFVQFRYSPDLVAWTPTLPSPAARPRLVRTGFHNDCFLASQTDVGTYPEEAGARAQNQAHMAALTAAAPFGGETCNPADDPGAVARTGCADILREGARYHLTYLNAAYYRRLTGPDPAEQLACARAWSQWEGATLSLLPDPRRVAEFGADHFAIAFARIECHYFVNQGFFAEDGQLLANAHRLAGIPGAIIQGRYDVVTPATTAWELHKAWPGASFTMVPDAGHTATEPGIADALVRATDRFVMQKTHG